MLGVLWLRRPTPRVLTDTSTVFDMKPGTRLRLTGTVDTRANFQPPPGATWALGWDGTGGTTGHFSLWVVGPKPNCVSCKVTIDATLMELPGGGPEGKAMPYLKV